jgi:hypothetical protein
MKQRRSGFIMLRGVNASGGKFQAARATVQAGIFLRHSV